MKAAFLILGFATLACTPVPYDLRLRVGAFPAPPGPPVVRFLDYELVVAVSGEEMRGRRFDESLATSLSDRVRETIDDLLLARGIYPERWAGPRQVRLVLIHGSSRTELWAYRGEDRKVYSTSANPPRRALEVLLDGMVRDLPP